MADDSQQSGAPGNNSADPGAQVSSDYIKLRVLGQDSNEVHFRVKFGTSLGKLKKSYADRMGVDVASLRFLFDGRRINDEDTPKSLEIEDDDIIEVSLSGATGWVLYSLKVLFVSMRITFCCNPLAKCQVLKQFSCRTQNFKAFDLVAFGY
ncbi:unnamed protein product [Thelazia callipaeda]|uniref:Ubiquitin-like domain-containing protein n=1 Tax=Thelazia callipaeda TaxID=103827 RepID=A0A0N5D6W9_THECL|nr:unnamed protein product [Thelazia callipaeda]